MIDHKAYAESKRLSAAKALARGYLKLTSHSRRLVIQMLEMDIAGYLHKSGVRLAPEAVDGLQSLVLASFAKGFEAGCRTGLSGK